MPGRNRRFRLVILFLVGAVVFVLLRRNSETIEEYKDRVTEKAIGGGAVIRPKPEENGPATSSSTSSDGRSEAITSIATTPAKVEVPQATTSSTLSISTYPAVYVAESTSSSPIAALTPQPSLQPVAEVAKDDRFPYQDGEGEGRVEVEIIPSATAKSVDHWVSQSEHFPISTTIQLPTGTPLTLRRIQRPQKKLLANGADEEKLAAIKEAAKHTWNGYRDFAWGMDEVKPVTGKMNNPFNGWGATLVDSLDTLWIMGMKEEFDEAVEAVNNIDFTTSPRSDIPIFETTIRYLGGLIAAYDVSGRSTKYRILLDKAVELAEVLYSIFDTPNRMPQTFYRWKPAFASQPHRAGTRVVLAEIGTLSLEFTRLAQLTGEPKYYDAIARITDAFEEWQNSTRMPGMWPTSLDASGCKKPAQMPATGTGTQTTNKQPVPDGSGMQMAAGAAIQGGAKEKSQKSLNEAVAAHQPGQGTISRFEEAKEQAAKDLRSDLGSSKRKRDVGPEDLQDSPVKLTREARKNNTLHQLELRTPPELLPGGNPNPPTQSSSDICLPQGLASTSASTQETYTLSGASDSMYEYLPKMYLLLGGVVDSYRTMYLSSAQTAIERLIYKSMTPDNLDILMSGEIKISPNFSQPADQEGGRDYIERFTAEAAHLACFAGGMFALGGVLFDEPRHEEIGRKLTEGCVWAYNVTQTGIMPEAATLMKCDEPDIWAEGACKWNETAYWRALDPYEETRMRTNAPSTPPTDASGGKHEAEKVLDKYAGVANRPDVQGVEEIRYSQDDNPNKVKRQLGEDIQPPLNRDVQPNPPPPQPGVGPGGVATPTKASPPEVVPPLPHAEFVRRKILTERLPPGYLRVSSRRYILRPEAIESVFYLYRITGDEHWREVGWQMFQAIEKHCKVDRGYSSIEDVTEGEGDGRKVRYGDNMESFWLAETLKYFWLLFEDSEKWGLDEWVLNTEAHFFRRIDADLEKV